jgi:hypothetical protein
MKLKGMWIVWSLGIVLLVASIAIGCNKPPQAPAPATITVVNAGITLGGGQIPYGGGSIRVVHDDHYRVTCWVVDGTYDHGISCLPDDQLFPRE